MAFNSLAFLVFISLFFCLWPFVKKKQNPKFLFLIICSFVFYGWWDWRFLFLIIFSGLIDYFAALLMHNHPRYSKLLLTLSILINISSLGIFKYSGFIADQLQPLFDLFEMDVHLGDGIPPFALILPVGISFYTFQSMSYTIDVYRKKLVPTTNILHFFSYLVLFPQLVAGPIVRAKDFLNQLTQYRFVSGIQFWNGIKLIILGYFQKTVLADNLGVFVDQAFAGIIQGTGLFWWIVMGCFAFQIYFDFCGYSQIARGLAKLMGFHFKMNFNHPYFATSMRDFWSRWHISLSTWFRDYVYIPLGGSKQGVWKSHLNMWITMLLSGLWHGAALNFLTWGAFHAFALSFERIFKKSMRSISLIPLRPVRWFVTLIQVIIGWVFFRATSFDQSLEILTWMSVFNFDISFILDHQNVMIFFLLALLFEGSYYLFRYVFYRFIPKLLVVESIICAVLIVSILFFRGPEQEFIYFQF